VGDALRSETSRPLNVQACLRATAAGALAGLVGGSYRWILDHIEPWRAELVAQLGGSVLGWIALAAVFALGAGLASWLTVRFAPEASGSGIPHVEETLARGGELRWKRLLPVKFVAGALALSAGLSLGREGPTVHLGAALAAALQGRLATLPRRALLAAGAAAGLTAAFSAPIAGAVFVLEELRVAPNLLMISTGLPAVLASYLVATALLGSQPMFALPVVVAPSRDVLPLFVALGIGAGILGVIFNRGLLAALGAFEAMRPVPKPLRAAAVGVFAAIVACWLPAAIGNGEPVAQALIKGPPSPLTGLVVLLAVKLVLTLASYGCGVPGGIFAPQLVLGATLGAIVHALVPNVGGGTLGPALVTAGMVGVFSASVRAPLTGLVLIVELTHHGQLLLPQAVTTLAGYLMAAAMRDRPIYEALRARDARSSAPATI
jgi:chloride channel protein, CIC family